MCSRSEGPCGILQAGDENGLDFLHFPDCMVALRGKRTTRKYVSRHNTGKLRKHLHKCENPCVRAHKGIQNHPVKISRVEACNDGWYYYTDTAIHCLE